MNFHLLSKDQMTPYALYRDPPLIGCEGDSRFEKTSEL
jgi:hypothetical protein